jgi:hypothetical protein
MNTAERKQEESAPDLSVFGYNCFTCDFVLWGLQQAGRPRNKAPYEARAYYSKRGRESNPSNLTPLFAAAGSSH